MTPQELNLFLNTPKASYSMPSGSSEIVTKNSGNIATILLLGVAVVAIGYAIHLHFENEKLKQKVR